MASFFVPNTSDSEQAERVWLATKTFIEDEHGWKGVLDVRIFRLGYMHDGEHMEAEVGKVHPYGYETSWEKSPPPPDLREPVLVILEREGGPFLVCTYGRGVKRGEPILVGSGERYEVIYFDGYAPET